MKNLMFLFLFIFSQFSFSQSGEDVNTIYIECNGDSIAVDVSQFPNLPSEMLFEMFDCSDEEDWSWGEDSTDVNNPWDEEVEFDCINSNPNAYALYMSCMNGDEAACEALEMLCGGEEEEGEEEEEEWGDDIDALIEQLENDCASQVDLGWSCGMLEMIYSCMNGSEDTCQYLEEIYEDFDFEEGEEEEWSWGEGENMGALFDVISSISVTENQLVLVLEANDLIISVFDQFGFEFSPSVVDGYMVFGPFDINELYNIIIENMDGLEVLWGLFKPMASDLELIEEGVVSALDSNFGDIFNLNPMVSVGEVHHDLKVYNTQYYDVMGRKVSNPSSGLYIEVQTTNLGEISNKRFIQK